MRVVPLSSKRLATVLMAACATVAVGVGPARAEDDKPKEPEIKITGLFDAYSQTAINGPRRANTNLAGRAFDVRTGLFNFAHAELAFSREAVGKIPFGFNVTIHGGKTADLFNATEPGGPHFFKMFEQLYGSAGFNLFKRRVQVDIGKYVTPFGFEVTEAQANDNYSRSYTFAYGPYYHVGARALFPITDKINAQLHVVNGWNNTRDDNRDPSFIASVGYAATSDLNFIVNWIGGNESVGAGLPGRGNLQLVDLVATYKPKGRAKYGLNIDHASSNKAGSGHYSSAVAYSAYQFLDWASVAARVEHFEDTNGIRTGAARSLNSATLTLNLSERNKLNHRFELRYDNSTTPFFAGPANTLRKSLFTATYALGWSF